MESLVLILPQILLVEYVVRTISPPFGTHKSFLDPLLTSENKPYAPVRFNELVKERYYITKYCNTSYLDVGRISPHERGIILSTIREELEERNKAIQERIDKYKNN